ncbi:hypothetical protein V5O48_002540 [Marasmius crinis-equi]|uniref:Ketoreductase domain-containing protein n=1 Tax=Marasmius crinis-equi TaxID=585013 RepID=A0ABR3FVZ9_9AGAR
MKVNDRTFIISGGSSGLGLATARELLASKAYVAVLDKKSPPSIDSNTPEASTSRLLYIDTDMMNVEMIAEAVEKAVAWTHRTGAHLAGIINCAGIGTPEPLLNAKGEPHSQSLWDRTLGVNLHGTFHLTRLAVKHLAQVPREDSSDGERGIVVMVSSTVAYEGVAGQTAYAASKGALLSMTLPMARELARHRIRVVTLVPGPFATSIMEKLGEKVNRGIHKEALLYPRRYGNPDEFAQTVKWVLDCPMVNGENLKLTGGMRMPARM